MNVNVETTPEALGTLNALHYLAWFPQPRNCTVAYTERGGILVTTSDWELYNIGPEGDVVRFYLKNGVMETVIVE